jgi:hypothetical protein
VYKDTAKWLLTFVPVTALVALVVAIAPRMTAVNAAGLLGWMCANPLATAAVALAVLFTVVIVALCCWVLLAHAKKWTELQADRNWLSRAFSDHAVGLPHFADYDAFRNAVVNVRTKRAPDAEQSAVDETVGRILKLSEDLEAQDRFAWFKIAFPICTLLAIAGVVLATASLPATPAAVTTPSIVSIFMPSGTEAKFLAATGCKTLDGTTAIAVGGLWNKPQLRLIGNGCPAGNWSPPDNLGVVVAPHDEPKFKPSGPVMMIISVSGGSTYFCDTSLHLKC